MQSTLMHLRTKRQCFLYSGTIVEDRVPVSKSVLLAWT